MSDTSMAMSRFNRDTIRQVLNVLFAFAQVFVSVLGYAIGTNAAFTKNDGATPPIVPAGTAFIVWAVIYGGAIAYAIYQALPRNRENELLRRIGFYTASAYLGTTVWVLAAQAGLNWLTVACFVWILISLLGAFIYFIDVQDTLTALERWLVVVPTSIYAGWTTVALIANIATALSSSGFNNVLLSNQNWTILVLLIGCVIASFTTIRSRGNIAYALTVAWALLWILDANIVRTPNTAVAVTAGLTTAIVLIALVVGRTIGRTLFPQERPAMVE